MKHSNSSDIIISYEYKQNGKSNNVYDYSVTIIGNPSSEGAVLQKSFSNKKSKKPDK